MTPPDIVLPQFAPSRREVDDIELLRMGSLAPFTGFGDGPDDVSLIAPDDVAESAKQAGALEIVDTQGVPLAVLTVEGTYDAGQGATGLIGPIRSLPGIIGRPFGDLYVPPSETRTSMPSNCLTVPIQAPLTTDDVAAIDKVAAGRPILLIVLAGEGAPHHLSAHGLIRACLATVPSLSDARIIAAPIAARDRHDADRAFFERAVRHYAPGSDLFWPEGEGSISPDVQDIVDQDRPHGIDQGLVIFFTGLSGSGKSTLAQALRDRILEHGIRAASLLDGDDVRRTLSAGLGFSPQDRETNIERIGWVAAEIGRNGGLAICSFIAPYDRTRRKARAMAECVGADFVLVHVSTPLEVCEKRDRKGLYAKARRGEVKEFTGISSAYEVPQDADIVIDTSEPTLETALTEILDVLTARGYFGARPDLGARPACR